MSKGLDALDSLMADYYEMCRELGNNDDQYQRYNLTSERAIIEKELQALEIIKTKLLVGCFSKEDNYSNYAMAIMMSGNETLKKNMMTEEEYNSVRGVLL